MRPDGDVQPNDGMHPNGDVQTGDGMQTDGDVQPGDGMRPDGDGTGYDRQPLTVTRAVLAVGRDCSALARRGEGVRDG